MNTTQVRTRIENTGSLWIPRDGPSESESGLVNYQGFCTLKEIADVEDRVAENVVTLVSQRTAPISEMTAEVKIREYEASSGKKLDLRQRDAVLMILNNTMSVLTGGPGTGKTTTLNCAAYCIRALFAQKQIAFAAPTGKAARRITETTGCNASTLHKMMNMGRTNKAARRYSADILICDESSMVDIFLADEVLKVSTENKRIVWLGDIDQIPSVGPGAVLRDLIVSGIVPVVMLTKTFRQKDGALLHNIKQVRDGKLGFESSNEFESYLLKDTNSVYQTIMESYKREIGNYGIENVAVLLPYHRAGVCSNSLNMMIQKMIHPSGPTYKHGSWMFRVDDPVMQQVNRPECVNGEVGKVISVSEMGVKVKYDSTTVLYGPDTLDELELAYAMSVTKSQGSEYASVLMVLLDSHERMLNKNILYTGISRAKQRCTLITQENALTTAVATTASARKTLLAEKIRAIS